MSALRREACYACREEREPSREKVFGLFQLSKVHIQRKHTFCKRGELSPGGGVLREIRKTRGVFTESVRKDIGEFLWKACGYLLEEDAALYREVSVEVKPAIKLSREIIQELQDDIKELQDNNKELQDNNKELQDNNKELHQEKENACRRLIEKVKAEEKSEKEAVKELMVIFALSEEMAKEKVKAYWC